MLGSIDELRKCSEKCLIVKSATANILFISLHRYNCPHKILLCRGIKETPTHITHKYAYTKNPHTHKHEHATH